MPPVNEMWRSLEELAASDEFRHWIGDEFPAGANVWLDGVSRRDFVKLAAASLALAGVTGCTRAPIETIVPYANTPEGRVQGQPQWFATAVAFRGFGIGVLAKSFEGRPVKIEGNPDHPASLGATNAIVQASVLDLYDPTRSTKPRRKGVEAAWDDFAAEVRKQIASGGRLCILTQTVTSPTLNAQIARLLAAFPGAKWLHYDVMGRDSNYAGTQMAFGAPLEPIYHFDRADVVVALDSDVLNDGPASVRYARDFARRRQPSNPNRLYAIEPMTTVTGSTADHRRPRKASDVMQDARALASRIAGVPAHDDPWIDAVARDLLAHRGAALVIPGDAQPPLVHALAHAMNAALGAIGSTAEYIDAVIAGGGQPALSGMGGPQAPDVFDDLGPGDILLILGGNPVYDAPADAGFAEKLRSVGLSAHLSSHINETSRQTTWHLPESHALEQWSDVRAFDGTATIGQPLIAPMYDTRSAIELLAMLSGEPASGHDIVKAFWSPHPNFEWRTSLMRGTIDGTTVAPRSVAAKPVAALLAMAVPAPSRGIELNLRPDPTIADGRYANNGWLQELPKPITKLVWGNAAFISPRFAEQQRLKNGQIVEIEARKKTVRAPVWIAPGHADDSVTLHLGHGREHQGGFNAYPLLFSDAPGEISIRVTNDNGFVLSTQEHNTLDGRDHLRVATLDQSRRRPDWVHDSEKEPHPGETLYDKYAYDGHAWGMTIDLNACIGCGGCVVACNAENNIPFVGRDQVARGREMQWLRIDRYFAGPVDDPKIYHQPVPCMHCEDAPCEPVCPVGATVHSSEGLNQMVYNRCIGTRYCSNNCPYKVRRFNFLQYAPKSDSLELMWNPDVTVRSRGVMEKCTYCVQRIERARVAASNEHRPVRDGEVVTACQQSCPTNAIVFGDINDPHSLVARLKAEQRNYAMLAELNTRPRTTYLGKVRNPNPELEKG